MAGGTVTYMWAHFPHLTEPDNRRTFFYPWSLVQYKHIQHHHQPTTHTPTVLVFGAILCMCRQNSVRIYIAQKQPSGKTVVACAPKQEAANETRHEKTWSTHEHKTLVCPAKFNSCHAALSSQQQHTAERRWRHRQEVELLLHWLKEDHEKIMRDKECKKTLTP